MIKKKFGVKYGTFKEKEEDYLHFCQEWKHNHKCNTDVAVLLNTLITFYFTNTIYFNTKI